MIEARPSVTLTLPQALGRALSAYKAGKLADAKRICEQIIAVKPDSFDALHLLAVTDAALCRSDLALASYDRALALRPDHAEAHYNRGVALQTLRRYDDAAESYDRALALRPDHAEALNNRGSALKELKRWDEALTSYDRALSLRPDYAAALYNRGNALQELKRYEAALESYDRALALTPDDAEAYNNRGNALKALKRCEEALASCDRALSIRPGFAEAHHNRGLVLHELTRYDEALESYDRALELRPNYAEALYNRGDALSRLARHEEALESYDRALGLRPDYAEALYNRGNALHELKRPDEALESYGRALSIRPDYPEACDSMAALLRELGRLTEAREYFERAVRLSPGTPGYYFGLAKSKRFAAGDRDLTAMEALARNPESLGSEQQIFLHFALAKALADVERHRESFEHLLQGNALKRRQLAGDEGAEIEGFERIRAAFTPEWMRSRQGFGNPSDVPIFILGMPRSGSTLVEQILASHPKVFGAGELGDFANAIAALEASSGVKLPEGIAGVSGDALRQLGTRYLGAIRALAPEAARITDKMPDNFRFIGLIHAALPRARIIHTRRDPIDTCLSCFSTLFRSGQSYSYDLRALGRYYRAYDALMQHWRRVLPPGVMLEVQYEEVVEDLEGQARRLVSYCGLDWDDSCLAFHETKRPVRTASATQVRQPIYKSAVGRGRVYEPFLGPLVRALAGEPASR